MTQSDNLQDDDLDSIVKRIFITAEGGGLYKVYTDAAKGLIIAWHQKHLEKAVAEAAIKELERLHRYDGKDYDTELDEIIDERIAQLQQKDSDEKR